MGEVTRGYNMGSKVNNGILGRGKHGARAWRVFLVFMLAAVVSACASLDESELTMRKLDYGTARTIDGDEYNYYLVRDDGALLYIVENGAKNIPVVDGERWKFTYDVISENTEVAGEAYDIKLYTIKNVNRKKPVFRLSEDDEDFESWDAEMGHDNLRRVDKGRVWFLGRYLNVEYTYLKKADLNKYPVVNLVAEQREDGVWELEIRCNANGNVPEADNKADFVEAESEVSFDLVSLFDKMGSTTASVEVTWLEYHDSSWVDTVHRSKSLKIRLELPEAEKNAQ
ncbi:NigD-like protein [Alistipes sp. OttesenSCG-928-B03]|nr:NigD-like protein [Alistipes sp. OttesenSCG-928-B03]